MSTIESLHARQTAEFISYAPDDVVITRRKKIATADGGWKLGSPKLLGEQRVRVVEMLRVQGRTQRVSSDGNLVVPTHVVILMPDGDIETYDHFPWQDRVWEVVNVSRRPSWRIQAEVYGRA